jgi:hypothetical protein
MLLSEPPRQIRARFRAMEERAHELDVTESNYRNRTVRVRVHLRGALIEMGRIEAGNDYEEDSRVREKRSAIQHFSAASRFRLMTALARVDRRGPLPIFITMTYPAAFPTDAREWKEHLRKFWNAVMRHFPSLSAVWKLEPQDRMAPHFHALCWGVSRVPWQWLAVRWACIIHGVRGPRKFPMGPGKQGAAEFRAWLETSNLPEAVKESIRVGTDVEKLETWNGVAYYVSKYISKAVPGGWENVGRYWGVVGRAAMPWSPVEEAYVDIRTAVLMKRTVRRFLRSKRYRVPRQMRRVSLITNNMDVWLRCFESLCGEAKRRVKTAGRGTRVVVTREQAIAAAFRPVPEGCVAEVYAPSKGGLR